MRPICKKRSDISRSWQKQLEGLTVLDVGKNKTGYYTSARSTSSAGPRAGESRWQARAPGQLGHHQGGGAERRAVAGGDRGRRRRSGRRGHRIAQSGSNGQAGVAERDEMACFLLAHCSKCLPQPLCEPCAAPDLQSLSRDPCSFCSDLWRRPMIFSRGRRRRGH